MPQRAARRAHSYARYATALSAAFRLLIDAVALRCSRWRRRYADISATLPALPAA